MRTDTLQIDGTTGAIQLLLQCLFPAVELRDVGLEVWLAQDDILLEGLSDVLW